MLRCRSGRTFIVPIGLLLVVLSGRAHAAFTTVITSPPDPIAVGANIPSNTQVNILTGAYVEGSLYIGDPFGPDDNIEINLNGGVINGTLASNGRWIGDTNVVINVRSGSVRDVIAGGANALNVSGGIIERDMGVTGQATAHVSGGSIGNLIATGSSQLHLHGFDFRLDGVPVAGLETVGSASPLDLANVNLLTGVLADGTPLAITNQGVLPDYIAAGRLTLHAAAPVAAVPRTFNAPGDVLHGGLRAGQRLVVQEGGVVPQNFNASWGSIVDVSGGEVSDGFEAVGSVVNIAGGEIRGLMSAFQGSVVNLANGAISSNFNVGRGATFNMTGGKVGGLFEILDGSRVSLAGGVVDQGLSADTGSEVAISGSGFRVNGVPVAGLNAIGAARPLDLPPNAVLSGTFADGRQFAFSNQTFDYFAAGTLKLIAAPAPASGPRVINVPVEAAPQDLRAGQVLLLSSGGEIGEALHADWGSVVSIDGGRIGGGFEAVGTMVNMTGGEIGWRFDAFYGSAVNISGGLLEGVVRAHQGSVINFSGGEIGQYLSVNSGGSVNISGGTVGYGVHVYEAGQLNVSGGTLGDYVTVVGGTLNVRGGSIGNKASVYFNGAAQLSGGTMGESFSVYNGGQVVLTGSDFRLNGVPLEGQPSPGTSMPVDLSSDDVLSGTLSDGTPFAFSNSDDDSLQPGTVHVMGAFNTNPTAPIVDGPHGPTPTGVGAGQSIAVGANRTLGDNFNAGWGSTVSIGNGAKVGRNFEAVGANVIISGGEVGENFDAFAGSRVTIAGGEVKNGFEAHRGSVVNITGGASSVTAKAGSEVDISGGEVAVVAETESRVAISGGWLAGLQIRPRAHVHLFGTDFQLDGAAIPGLLPGATIELNINDLRYSAPLVGTLADGSPFMTSLRDFTFYWQEDGRPTVLTITNLFDADLNRDGLVDGADLQRWKQSFGVNAGGDVDENGVTDGRDFLLWQRQHWDGFSGPARAGVPEPCTAGLLLIAICGAALSRAGVRRR